MTSFRLFHDFNISNLDAAAAVDVIIDVDVVVHVAVVERI